MRQRGFVLIAMSVSMVLMLAFLGLAFDFGRIYITRNEAQVFTDAASMAAAAKLDGTPGSLAAARAAVQRLPNRWNLGSQKFDGVVVEFSADGEKWYDDTEDEADMKFARVTAGSNELGITFLQAVGGPQSFNVPTRSVSAANPVRLIQ